MKVFYYAAGICLPASHIVACEAGIPPQLGRVDNRPAAMEATKAEGMK